MCNKNKKMKALLLAICAVGLGNAQLWSVRHKTELRTSEESISGAGSSVGSSMMEDPYGVTSQEEMVQTPGFAGEEYYSDVEYKEVRPGERKYKGGLPLVRDIGVEPSRELEERKVVETKESRSNGGAKKTYKKKTEYGTGKEGRKHKKETKTKYEVKRDNGNGDNGGRKYKREYRTESRCRRCVRD